MSTQLDNKRLEFRDRFIARTADQGSRLDDLMERLVKPAPEEAIREIEHKAHRLAGSAGSYGFPALGELAALVEQEVARGRHSGTNDIMGLLMSCCRLREGMRELNGGGCVAPNNTRNEE